MIEMALVFLVLVFFTGGLLDVGRAFYQNTQVGSAAEFGARWASAVGGTCLGLAGASTTDWCNQLGTSTSNFWSQPGNVPRQTGGATCPSSYDPNFTGYYAVSDFANSTSSTIVGAIAQRFDTNSSSTNIVGGSIAPGFDPGKLKVCIQLTWIAARSMWSAAPGDKVSVHVYYPFRSVTSLLLANKSVNLVASAETRID